MALFKEDDYVVVIDSDSRFENRIGRIAKSKEGELIMSTLTDGNELYKVIFENNMGGYIWHLFWSDEIKLTTKKIRVLNLVDDPFGEEYWEEIINV